MKLKDELAEADPYAEYRRLMSGPSMTPDELDAAIEEGRRIRAEGMERMDREGLLPKSWEEADEMLADGRIGVAYTFRKLGLKYEP